MNKTTKQILAILSIVLSVAIVVGAVLFVLASCDDNDTVKKRKKKVVIVKKPSTSQNDDDSEEEEEEEEDPYDTDFESDEDDEDDEYYDDEDYEEEDYEDEYYDDEDYEDEEEDDSEEDDSSDDQGETSDVEEPSDDEQQESDPDEEESEEEEEDEDEDEEEVYPYEVRLDGKGGLAIANPLNQKIGMSFYHFYQGEWDFSLAEAYGATEAEFMNYYRIGGIQDLKALKEKNGLGWSLVGNPFPTRDTLNFRDGWEESMLTSAEAFKYAGVWDQLAGYETEEICMAVTQEQYKKLTRFLRDNFPDKRIFSCLSMYEVRGTAPTGFTIAPMSYDTYGYITDIGYDWYSHLNVQQYRDAVKLMLENMGREDNVRVWFFPTSYRFGPDSTEDFCIQHLNIMYDMLMDKTLVKNPGGLYCYTWKSFGNGEGIAELCDPARQFKWTRFGNELVRVGKEILASDYRYDYSVIN